MSSMNTIVDNFVVPINTSEYYVYNDIILDRDDTYLNALSQHLIQTYLSNNNSNNKSVFSKHSLSNEKIMLRNIIDSQYFGEGFMIREFDLSNDDNNGRTKRIILANIPCKSVLSHRNGVKFHFHNKHISCDTKFQHHQHLRARIVYTFSKQKRGSILRQLGLYVELYCMDCQHQVYTAIDTKEVFIYVNSPKAHEMDNVIADILVNKYEIHNIKTEITNTNKPPYIATNYYVVDTLTNNNDERYNIIDLVKMKIKQVLKKRYGVTHHFDENDIFVCDEQ